MAMNKDERALYIYKRLREAGATHAGACGVLGNLQGETSDFDPRSCETSYLNRFGLTDDEYTRRADNDEVIYDGKKFIKDSAGYGIAQWTYWSRKQDLLNLAKARGKSVGDLDVQIELMLNELKGHYGQCWKVISTADDYTKAVKICVTDWEKPANQSNAITRRNSYAKVFYNEYKNIDAAPVEEGTKEPVKEPAGASSVASGFDRREVIALAEAQVGYLEKKNESNLDDNTANAGANNYTKYARDLDAISGFYNGKKQGFAWCDIFVDWLFVKCFGVEDALNLLCAKMGSSGAGCTYSLNYYLAKGQFIKRDAGKPQVGDQIFFGNVGNSNHTGIVYKVDDSKVYTIEGNTSGTSGVIANGGGVFKKSYALNYSQIAGYGRPAYNDGFTGNEIIDSAPAEKLVQKEEEAAVPSASNYPILKLGDTGTYVKKAQQLLIAKGHSCGVFGADGVFGSEMLSAVKEFQSANGLEVDGEIGPITWAKLLEEEKKEEIVNPKPKQDNVPAPTPSKTQFDRQILLDVALAEIGYKEKKNESNLDDKEANAGTANYNKYARDLDAIENWYYHDRKQGLNWCDIFCDWCFVQAYGVNDAFTVSCQPQYSYGAGCGQSVAYYKAQNRFDNSPQVGDQFFLSDGMGSTGHTGLVLEVHDTYVVTIEGNQEIKNDVEGVVKRVRYPADIYGFGHPMYNDGYGTDKYIGKKAEEPKPIEKEEDKKEEPVAESAVFVPPILKQGDKGQPVRKLQALLVYSGYSVGASGIDADFGSATTSAIKKVQKCLNRPQTGIADEFVWAALLK